MPVAPDTVVRRADVVWRRTLDAVLVRVPGGGDVVELAGTGVALWDGLVAARRFDDLCVLLAHGHGAPVDEVTADLSAAVADLAARGVLACE